MKDEVKKVEYRIAKKSHLGWDIEGAYASYNEAEAALKEMEARAIAADKVHKDWLIANPKPWNKEQEHKAWVNGYDNESPFVRFTQMGYHIAVCLMTDCVVRLNTLPADSPVMMREIEMKMAAFGRITIDWSCFGHTRAEWQSEAAAVQVAKAHPEWDVTATNRNVVIKEKRQA